MLEFDKSKLIQEEVAKLIIISRQKKNSFVKKNEDSLNFLIQSGNVTLNNIFNKSDFIFFIEVFFNYLKPEKNWLINGFSKFIENKFLNIEEWLVNELSFFKSYIKIQKNDYSIIDSFKVLPNQILPCYNKISLSKNVEIIKSVKKENNEINYFTISGTKLPTANSVQIENIFDPSKKIYIGANSIASQADFSGLETMRRNFNYDRDLEFAKNIKKSLFFLKKIDNDQFLKNIQAINSIVPCMVDTKSYPSGSTTILPHTIFVKFNMDYLMTCEMLIHESSHVALNFKNFAEKIIICECSQTSNVFYSPWRDDARPLNGIIHGLYVFLNVSNFWKEVIEKKIFADNLERDVAIRRYHTLISQLKSAIDQDFPLECLSKFGQEFLNSLINKINNLNILDPECMINKQVFYAENHSKWNFEKDTISDAITKHKNNWKDFYISQ